MARQRDWCVLGMFAAAREAVAKKISGRGKRARCEGESTSSYRELSSAVTESGVPRIFSNQRGIAEKGEGLV